MPETFRINSPHVVAETLDGETTIVNLDSGTYYALNDSGSAIWEALARGAAQDAVASSLAARFEIELDRATSAVGGLIDELRAQDLIVAADGTATPSGETASPNGSRGTYADPELSTYTDMQELLLLDPIHEVDEAGWPNRPF